MLRASAALIRNEAAHFDPLLPLTIEAFAAVQLHQTSRSCIAQHFGGLIVGQRTERALGLGFMSAAFPSFIEVQLTSMSRTAHLKTKFS
jgi:hypothetical protein